MSACGGIGVWVWGRDGGCVPAPQEEREETK